MQEHWQKPYWGKVFGRSVASPLGWSETIGQFGKLPHLLLYADLLFPKTSIVEGVVFLDLGEADVDFNDTRTAAVGKAREMVGSAGSDYISSFNWVDIYGLFSMANDDSLTEAESGMLVRDVAKTLRSAWELVLHARYPSRRFIVRILEENETGYGFGVEFREIPQ
jgi:hypothetical protein